MTWNLTRIDSFCDTGSGGTPSRKVIDRYFGGDIPWVKSGELREGTILATEETLTKAGLNESAAKIVPAGALLVALYGATVGRIALLGIDAATNQAVCHIIPRDPNVDRRFLFHALRQCVPNWLSRRVGGAQPNISQQIIRATQIPLPPPAEQRRIADILDRADALRAQRRAALAQLDLLPQAIFLEMFGEPARNPKRYPRALLSDLIRNGDVINYGVVQPGNDVPDGVPVIRVGDLSARSIDVTSLKRISPAVEASHKRSRLVGDEILVSCVGTIGIVTLATPDHAGFNIARAVARVPLSNDVDRVFVAEYLRTEHVKRYFVNELRTVSQPTLNILQLGQTSVLVPPLAVQQAFANRAGDVSRLRTTLELSLSELDALFASLQHRAFRGEL